MLLSGLKITFLIGPLALTALRQTVKAGKKNVSSLRVLHHLADLADALFFFFILTAAIELK